MIIKQKLQAAIRKWHLTNIEIEYETENKAVYFGVADKYGDVVLKINVNGADLYKESEVLQEFQGMYCCKIYDYDTKENILLEERILPGIELRSVTEVNKRLDNFAIIFNKIHRQAKGNYFTMIVRKAHSFRLNLTHKYSYF